jgi:hypothetical protein
MKKFNLQTILTLSVIFILTIKSFSVMGQEYKAPNIDELPEYIIITSENTKLLGGINIIIDYKKSEYKAQLSDLEVALQSAKGFKIRNQTDLLNTMSSLGFEYVDAYNANAGTIGVGGGDDITVSGSDSKFRTNMVFRKKLAHRD